MKFKELKTKTKPELERLLKTQREKLRDLRFKVARKQYKNVREIRKTRKLIAQILTLLNTQDETSVKSTQNNKKS